MVLVRTVFATNQDTVRKRRNSDSIWRTQKTYTEDFLTGRRVKNVGQRDRYYVSNSHEGIVSKETFEKVQKEMASRKRVVQNEDGSIEVRKEYNAQNVLANILVCGDCGASFRRRTERGKVVYRCATRMEKGKTACDKSPTLQETWLKDELSKRVCDGTYDERVIRELQEKLIYDVFNK